MGLPGTKKEVPYKAVYQDSPPSMSSESFHDHEAQESLLHHSPSAIVRPVPWMRLLAIICAAANSFMLIVTLALLNKPTPPCKCTERECAAMTSFYSPLLEEEADAIEYETVRFEGALLHENVYKGAPNPKLDEAWEELMHLNNSVVNSTVLDHIGKDRIAVHYAKEQDPEEKYFIGIEVFHHMHCLNIIRQYTYKEYYMRPENLPEPFTDTERTIRKHIDHCIDMLRQVLLCNGDVGIVTSNWVKGFGMYPDFSTLHKCRKMDKIVAWADRHFSDLGEPLSEPSTIWLESPPP